MAEIMLIEMKAHAVGMASASSASAVITSQCLQLRQMREWRRFLCGMEWYD
jgi:hypothetical protein